jgi:diguanylate cyclase (GGDEF)-like protein/PAS domain S-box-containing protein
MGTTHETIRVLILDESQNDAEKLISLLRNAGHATRAHRITSEEQLVSALKDQTWDLLLARPHSGECTGEQAITQIKRLEKDTPTILLIDNNDSAAITKGLSLGMRDVIPFDEDSRLVLVINRELLSLQDRRGRRLAEIALHEAEKRCSLLLDSSQNPVAYVLDGMHIYANDTYMRMFGYSDADELAGMPLVDMITGDDQSKFKEFLKRYAADPDNASEFTCGFTQGDGSTANMVMKLSAAEYDGEACTQIVLRPNDNNRVDLEMKLQQLSSQDLLTGLSNRSAFLESLDLAVEKALKQQQISGLCYINLDAYTKTCAKIGITGADTLLAEVAQILKKVAPEKCQLARLGDDIFTALINSTDIDTTLAFAEKVRADVEHHLFDISGITVQITCSISVLLINETTPASQEIVSRAMRVSEILTRKGGNDVMQYQSEKDNNTAPASPEDSVVALIEDAISNDKLALLFQPIISLQGDPNEHYETLLSLPNENGSFMSAFDILTAAQHVDGLCQKIDRWVIIKAMKSLIEHRAGGHNTRLFVNLTAAALQDPELISWVNDAFKEVALPPDAVIFQFNENDAVTYLKQVKIFTEGLAKLQIKVSIANFGCALNPMNTLKHITADYIKLDGSFTMSMQKNKGEDAIIKQMLADLKAENKMTIVPLVENATMLSVLWQAGASFIQGHYVQVPSPQMNYDFSTE